MRLSKHHSVVSFVSHIAWLLCFFAYVIVSSGSTRFQSPGLIRPEFTPIHLVANSQVIVEATMTMSAIGSVHLTPRRALRGSLPVPVIVQPGNVDEEFWKEIAAYCAIHPNGLTVAWLQGNSDQGQANHSICSMQGHWMSIEQTASGEWEANRDKSDLNGVWAGSGVQLLAAMAYIMSDPKADMPVFTGASWKGVQTLGAVSGTVAMTMTATLPSLGPCLIIAASNGDRVIRTAAFGGRAGDATADLALKGGSKLIAAGDATGTGVVDLVRWNGQELSVFSVAQRTNTPVPGAPSALRYLSIAAGGRIVAFTATAPVILYLQGPAANGAAQLAAPLAAWGEGTAGCIADIDGDGFSDIAQVFSKGIVIWKGLPGNAFSGPELAYGGVMPDAHTVLLCDADADGRLDMLVAGSGKDHPILRQVGPLRFENVLRDSGEIDYHAPRSSVAASVIDINLDGRADVLLLPKNQAPKLYFNRGFACFGYAREIHLDAEQSPPAIRQSAAALGDGCLGGGTLDIDADGQPDVVAIDMNGNVTALLTNNDVPERMSVSVSPHPTAGPVVISAREGSRSFGTRIASAAQPVVFGKLSKGPLVITWAGTDGATRSKSVIILKSQAVTLP